MYVYLNASVSPFLRSVRLWVAAVTAAALAAAGFSIGVAFALAGSVSALLSAEGVGVDTTGLVGWLTLAAGFALARGTCLWLRDQLAAATAARVKRSVRERLVGKLFELGPGYAGEGGRGAVQTTVVDGVEHLQGYVGFYLPQLIVSWLVPATVVVVLAFIDPWIALLVVACAALVPFAQRIWRFVLRKRAMDHWDRYEAFADRLGDTVRGMTTLVALGAVRRRAVHIAHAAEELRKATTANMRASLGVSAVMMAAMSIGTAGATVLAAWEAARGALPIGSVLLVLFLAAEAFRPQQELNAYWHEGFYGIAAAEGIARLLAAEPPVTDTATDRSATVPAAPSLVVENLTYTFPGTDTPVLDDVSFAVPGGATLAIVGPSGAGKTTLGRLLLRDLDVDAGRIILADRDLREYPLPALRRDSARVAQDVVLLSGTIRENVELAAATLPENARRDRVTSAIRGAQLNEVADALPEGLDSQAGESGALLSGGQRQRVALARSFVVDAKLMLLDEATSALDAENERLITELMRARRNARTTVVIAHRLSTVAHADYVLVLERGRVVEFGPRTVLAQSDGPWARLVDAQTVSLTGAS